MKHLLVAILVLYAALVWAFYLFIKNNIEDATLNKAFTHMVKVHFWIYILSISVLLISIIYWSIPVTMFIVLCLVGVFALIDKFVITPIMYAKYIEGLNEQKEISDNEDK